jgi:hypothetical protein
MIQNAALGQKHQEDILSVNRDKIASIGKLI